MFGADGADGDEPLHHNVTRVPALDEAAGSGTSCL